MLQAPGGGGPHASLTWQRPAHQDQVDGVMPLTRQWPAHQVDGAMPFDLEASMPGLDLASAHAADHKGSGGQLWPLQAPGGGENPARRRCRKCSTGAATPARTVDGSPAAGALD